MVNNTTLRIICILSLLFIGNITSEASVDGFSLGQLDTDLPKVSPYGTDEGGKISAAMMINPDFNEEVSDTKIVGVRFGLTSKINISSASVWASYSLDEEPFMEHLLTQEIVKGWNEVDLPEGIAVDNKPFYVGYTLTTEGPTYPVAIIENGYETGFAFNDGNGWKEYNAASEGSLAISVKVDGNNLPLYDLGIISVETPVMLNSREDNLVNVKILNYGSRKVSGFKVTCVEDNNEATTQEWGFVMDIEPNRRATADISFIPLSPDNMHPIPVTMTISALTEGDDFDSSNNDFTFSAAISPYYFKKRLLVEEYTSEYCSNCPAAASLLHETMEKEENRDRVMAVCHHAGFQNDAFTQPCDEELIELYGSSSTYAPAMSFDRSLMPGNVVITHVPGSVKDMQAVFDVFLSREALVDMEVIGEYLAETRQMKVSVDGLSITGGPLDEVNALTVYLLEDNVKPAVVQLGANEDFLHSHVIRAYNSVWGDEIEWSQDGKFSYSTEFKVPEGINQDNVTLVAFASKHNPTNHFDCEIANSVKSNRIDWNASGVESTVGNEMYDVRYYDLMGMPVSSDSKGILIRIQTLRDGKQIVDKILKM